MGRAPCCDKATVKKGPWSPEEDAMLKNYIETHGTGNNWIALPNKIGLKRCGKSCRLRWLNYLRPNIKHGDFTPEEDSIICSLYISIGSRWSIIAAQLPGRTDNDVKNYWNTKLKKRLLGRRKGHRQSQSATADDPQHGDAVNSDGGERPLSASAMERIQLCMQLQEMHNPITFHHNNPSPWQPTMTSTQSNNTSNDDVTVAGQQGMVNGQQPESATTMASSPSSHSDVVTIEAELQELLYGEAGQAVTDVGGAPPQGDVEWWSYDQDKQSPVNCWDFIPETLPVFQDYTTVYDI